MRPPQRPSRSALYIAYPTTASVSASSSSLIIIPCSPAGRGTGFLLPFGTSPTNTPFSLVTVALLSDLDRRYPASSGPRSSPRPSPYGFALAEFEVLGEVGQSEGASGVPVADEVVVDGPAPAFS